MIVSGYGHFMDPGSFATHYTKYAPRIDVPRDHKDGLRYKEIPGVRAVHA